MKLKIEKKKAPLQRGCARLCKHVLSQVHIITRVRFFSTEICDERKNAVWLKKECLQNVLWREPDS